MQECFGEHRYFPYHIPDGIPKSVCRILGEAFRCKVLEFLEKLGRIVGGLLYIERSNSCRGSKLTCKMRNRCWKWASFLPHLSEIWGCLSGSNLYVGLGSKSTQGQHWYYYPFWTLDSCVADQACNFGTLKTAACRKWQSKLPIIEAGQEVALEPSDLWSHIPRLNHCSWAISAKPTGLDSIHSKILTRHGQWQICSLESSNGRLMHIYIAR